MRGRLAWIAGFSVVCSPVSAALGQPAPTAQPAPQIHKEWALGKQVAQELDSRDGRIDDPALMQYLQRIENRLAAAAGQKPLEIRVTRSSEEYATVLANGVQYLSAGLAKRLENEMELAGLLAHQLAHRQVAGGTTAQIASIPLYVPSCVLSPFGIPGGIGQARNREQQATGQALGYLKAAGYDPTGVSGFILEARLRTSGVDPGDRLRRSAESAKRNRKRRTAAWWVSSEHERVFRAARLSAHGSRCDQKGPQSIVLRASPDPTLVGQRCKYVCGANTIRKG